MKPRYFLNGFRCIDFFDDAAQSRFVDADIFDVKVSQKIIENLFGLEFIGIVTDFQVAIIELSDGHIVMEESLGRGKIEFVLAEDIDMV